MEDGSTITFVQSSRNSRSAVACKRCKAKKTRCSLTKTGNPCMNCLHEGVECEIAPRKKHEHRKSKINVIESPYPAAGSGGQIHGICDQLPTRSNMSGHDDQITNDNDALPESMVLENIQTSTDVPFHAPTGASIPDKQKHPDEGGNSAVFAEALAGNSPFTNQRSFYAGDQQGFFHSVREICVGRQAQPTPAQPASTRTSIPRQSLTTDDLIFLQSRGVFSLPAADVCDSLIQSYFEHVHPLLPILDASQFLSQYTRTGAQAMNLLLLWSVFLAASNFASPATLRAARYSCRKSLKRAMYAKAKALYDSNYENDKICVVQSVALMAFWYSDAEDRNGPWHWIGVAIGLCQVMGLHRASRGLHGNSYAGSRQCLYRRIWWSCFLRDRWLSLGLGRPMRIDLDDCDVQMPSPEDVNLELQNLDPHIIEKYLPFGMQEHSIIWVRLIRLSKILGEIIQKYYRRSGTRPECDTIHSYEVELENCQLPETISPQAEHLSISLNTIQFEMLLEATIVVLHRPRIDYSSQPDSVQNPDQMDSLRKARAAAARTNRLLEKVVEVDMVHTLRPMSITAIIPAMQIHLFDCKSARPLARNVAWSKLEVGMLVLTELRDTYWGANFTLNLFETARSMLKGQQMQTPNQGGSLLEHEISDIPLQDTNSTSALPQNGQETMDLTESFWPMDGFVYAYLDPDVGGFYDAAPNVDVSDPWSLDGFQNVLDASFN